jgi:predicted enzyme related to lactoylglutathione lyase
VPDAAAAVSAADSAGGKTLAPLRSFPRLGTSAIVADGEGTPIGLLQSATGDTADYPTKDGDWAWFELFAKNPAAAGDFYRRVFHFQVAADTRASKEGHFILSTDQNRRGGIQPLVLAADAQPDWLGFVQVEDLDATIAHASTLGGQLVAPPSAPELASRFAIISDPTGGVIGIVQFVNDVNPATAGTATSSTPQ